MLSHAELPSTYLAEAETFETLAKTQEEDVAKSLWGKAIQCYSSLLEKSPKHIVALTKRGLLYKKLGNLDASKIDLENAVNYRIEEKFYVGKYHAKLSRYLQNSISDANGSLLDTNGSEHSAFLGFDSCSEGKEELAYFYFSEAIERFPDDFISLTMRAIILCKTNPKAALTDLATAINKYNYSAAYLTRGGLFFETDKESAKEDFIDCIILSHRDDANLLNQKKAEIFSLLNDKQDIDTAEITSCTEKIIQSPESANLYVVRGLEYQKLGYYKKANLDFSMAIWLGADEDIPDYYLYRSKSKLKAGDLASALEDIKISQQFISPAQQFIFAPKYENFSHACLQLGKKAVAEKNFSYAHDLFAAGIQIMPIIELHLELGKVLNELKKPEEASKQLDKAFALGLQERQSHLRTAVIHTKYTSDFLDAEKKYKREAKEKKVKPIEEPVLIDPISSPKKNKKQTPQIKVSQPANDSQKEIQVLKAKERAEEAAILKATAQKQKALQQEEEKAQAALLEKIKIETAQLEAQKKLQQEAEQLEREARQKEKSQQEKIKNLEERQLRNKLHQEEQKKRDLLNQSPIKHTYLPPKRQEASNLFWRLLQPREDIFIPLEDIERQIFDKFEAVKNENNASYSTLVVGGSVFDRVRKKLCHYDCKITDIDFVTEIPIESAIEQIRTLFPETKTFVSKHIKNLFSFTVNKQSIDILCEASLNPLQTNALQRDFAPLYADRNGKVLDPTGRGIDDLLKNQARTIKPPSEIFPSHPIIMLRAIYQSTKRKLKIQGEKHILTYRHHLTTVEPGFLNARIRKLFFYQHAAVNYKRLWDFKIFEILFPSLEKSLQTAEGKAWITAEMEATSKIEYPNLQHIYASFIICTIMQNTLQKHRRQALEKKIISFSSYNNAIMQNCKYLIAQSPLLHEAFAEMESSKLEIFLKQARKSWEAFHYKQPEEQLTTSAISSSASAPALSISTNSSSEDSATLTIDQPKVSLRC